jgi:hypothetical protein
MIEVIPTFVRVKGRAPLRVLYILNHHDTLLIVPIRHESSLVLHIASFSVLDGIDDDVLQLLLAFEFVRMVSPAVIYGLIYPKQICWNRDFFRSVSGISRSSRSKLYSKEAQERFDESWDVEALPIKRCSMTMSSGSGSVVTATLE